MFLIANKKYNFGNLQNIVKQSKLKEFRTNIFMVTIKKELLDETFNEKNPKFHKIARSECHFLQIKKLKFLLFFSDF